MPKRKIPVKTKEAKALDELIQTCVKNAKARRSSKKAKQDWLKEYQKNFENVGFLPARPESMVGVCAKRTVFDSSWKNAYPDNEELQQREQLALKETLEKSKKIAPISNKSNYVYIGEKSKEDIQTLGRKI